ncbi:MAG: FAD-binding oxidoreductase [Syntrophorhabdus sp.]|jgi:FAD/FMN-containing dehydrogenase|nr:FAD-binding oxidoreductase [Pseudomonadota bacterium]NMC93338.1 FAD-binding oxidoreductase [Syntrophorhabdus sp.]HNY70868.1 FAD-binding oxidoreductase [Syntrophorhabdus sp.]HOH27851.1 FAD-binding oxidoreductase [Syntrophorhabdus sp.]HQB35375.1 FAD-binding oxidoreductase [Syntrophorhabdus sp.]
MGNIDDFYKEVLKFIPEDRVSRDEAVLYSYATDLSSPPGVATIPPVVVLPESVEEVRELLMAADRFRVPVVPSGRGANIAGLSVPHQEGEIVVDLRRMDRILEVNTDAAYAVVEPGVTHHQMSSMARAHGFIQHLPTATGGASTVANALMRPSGNLSAKWDPDPVISLEVVTPSGQVIRTGSASFGTAGWRARYTPFPDLTGLFACSYGTLGIVTKAAIKLHDRGEEERLLITKWNELPPVVDFIKLIIRRNVADSCTFWNWTWNMFHSLMHSRTEELPAVMMKEDQKTPPPGVPFGIASARLSGYREVVDAAEKTAIRLARERGGEYMPEDELKQVHPGSWEYLHSYFIQGIHPKPGEEATMRKAMWLPGWLINAEPKAILELEKFMWEFARKEAKPPYMFRILPFNHAREFFFAFVILIAGTLDKEKEYMLHLKSVYKTLYHELLKKYGAVMFRFRQDPSFLALTGPYGELLRQIKAIVDPNNIMHPGVNLF